MNVLLVLAEDKALYESLRAALPETDLLLLESTVERALRRLISLKVDAVLIDDTPRLGREALARFQESAPGLPNVVFAARSDAETLASYTMAGARAAIPKPFSCDDLSRALHKVLQPVPAPPEPAAPASQPAAAMPSALGQHQTALRWLSRLSSHIKEPESLTRSLVDAATDIFDAVRAVVLLEVEGSVRVAASHGLAPSVADTVKLDFSTGLMRWFEQNVCLIDREANQAAADAVKEMKVLGARLGAPLLSCGRVYGAILVGERASGLNYTDQQRELLTSVARCASTAIDNSRLYLDASRQRARLDTVLANVTAGVVVVAPNKTVTLMNQSAERILQLRAADMMGRSVQKLGSGFADVVLRTLAEGKPRLRQEVRDPAIDAVLGFSAAPVGQEGVVVIFSKIPEEKASSEDVAYSPFWEYLASRVAQEIKNPMVAVNTFAQLLPRKYDSEDFRHAFAEVVQKEIVRINTVVETLFEFARHPRLVLQHADVNETVRSVLQSFEKELSERSIELEVNYAPGMLGAELDPVYFAQAVHNVVQNAIEAMPEGGKLAVQTRERGKECEVTVSDTGPGVSPQDAPLIFLPFFSTKEQGMGPGLTFASRIMRQHDGELKLASSEQGCGAFSFSLPSKKDADADHSGH
jgi:signal transduction histidine kinase/DNA-binding NarL/FixJ family response regulator